jgi:aspartate/methionine/tyrosine aminotransferase
MPHGPVQAAAVVALADDGQVAKQRGVYQRRLRRLIEILAALDLTASMPDGAFYLWFAAPDGDAWGCARMLAERAGLVASLGEFYGERSANYLRLAVVAPDDRLELAAARVGLA